MRGNVETYLQAAEAPSQFWLMLSNLGVAGNLHFSELYRKYRYRNGFHTKVKPLEISASHRIRTQRSSIRRQARHAPMSRARAASTRICSTRSSAPLVSSTARTETAMLFCSAAPSWRRESAKTTGTPASSPLVFSAAIYSGTSRAAAFSKRRSTGKN